MKRVAKAGSVTATGLALLNQAYAQAPGARIFEVIRLWRELRKDPGVSSFYGAIGPVSRDNIHKFQGHEKTAMRLGRLEDLLLSYRFHPPLNEELGKIVWKPRLRFIRSQSQKPRLHVNEGWLISWVVDLASRGMMDLLRRCVCGKWFIGRGANQNSCSALCRHKLYRQTGHYKQDHRLYARWRYQHESRQTRLSFQQWKRQEEREVS